MLCLQTSGGLGGGHALWRMAPTRRSLAAGVHDEPSWSRCPEKQVGHGFPPRADALCHPKRGASQRRRDSFDDDYAVCRSSHHNCDSDEEHDGEEQSWVEGVSCLGGPRSGRGVGRSGRRLSVGKETGQKEPVACINLEWRPALISQAPAMVLGPWVSRTLVPQGWGSHQTGSKWRMALD